MYYRFDIFPFFQVSISITPTEYTMSPVPMFTDMDTYPITMNQTRFEQIIQWGPGVLEFYSTNLVIILFFFSGKFKFLCCYPNYSIQYFFRSSSKNFLHELLRFIDTVQSGSRFFEKRNWYRTFNISKSHCVIALGVIHSCYALSRSTTE